MPTFDPFGLLAKLREQWEWKKYYTQNFYVPQRWARTQVAETIRYEAASAIYDPPLGWPDILMSLPKLVDWQSFTHRFETWRDRELPPYSAQGFDCEDESYWVLACAAIVFDTPPIAPVRVSYEVHGQPVSHLSTVVLVAGSKELWIMDATPRSVFTNPPPESPFLIGSFGEWKVLS